MTLQRQTLQKSKTLLYMTLDKKKEKKVSFFYSDLLTSKLHALSIDVYFVRTGQYLIGTKQF